MENGCKDVRFTILIEIVARALTNLHIEYNLYMHMHMQNL